MRKLALVILFLMVLTLPVNGLERAVLFDNAHLQTIGNANWTITGGFSDFAETFRNMGFKVDEIKSPVTFDILKKYSIFVVGEPNIRFSDDEERAILNWVKSGGRLYVIADHANSDRNNDGYDSIRIFNRFSKNFGFEFQEAWIGKLAPIKIKSKNDILNNVDNVGIWGGTIAKILDKNKAKGFIPVTYKDRRSGKTFVGDYLVLAEYGKGRIVALGDSSPYDDGSADDYRLLVHDGYNQVDYGHRQLARNTIAWLMNEDIKKVIMPFDIKLRVKKLSVALNKELDIPFKLISRKSGEAHIKYYVKNIEKDNLIYEKNISVNRGINDISFPFRWKEAGLLRVYLSAKIEGIKEEVRAFTTVKVGRIPRLCLDMSHENDWCNRVKAFRVFLDEQGIFFTASRKDLSKDLNRPDVNIAVITAPKKGVYFRNKDIMAVINFLKRGGTLFLIGSSDSAKWGDGANLKPLVDALNLPLVFNDDTVKINDPKMKNSLISVDSRFPNPTGEVPCSLIKNKNGKGSIKIISIAPDGSTNFDNDGDGFIKYDKDAKIPVDAIIDLSHSDLGSGKVVLFGSSHITDINFKKPNKTSKYWRNILNYVVEEKNITPLSQILPTTKEGKMIIMGVVKSFNGKKLIIEDSGAKLTCVGNFPENFHPEKGKVVKIKGNLVKKGNWFILEIN